MCIASEVSFGLAMVRRRHGQCSGRAVVGRLGSAVRSSGEVARRRAVQRGLVGDGVEEGGHLKAVEVE